MTLVQNRPRLLHPVNRRAKITRRRRSHVIDVAPDQIRVVHHLELLVLRVARVVLALHLARQFRDRLLLENGVLGLLNRGAEQVHQVFREQHRARHVAHLVARLLLVARGAEEPAVLQVIRRAFQCAGQPAGLRLLQRRARTLARRRAIAFARHLFQLVQQQRDLVLDGDLINFLLAQVTLLILAEIFQRLLICLPRQPHAHAHVH